MFDISKVSLLKSLNTKTSPYQKNSNFFLLWFSMKTFMGLLELTNKNV